ncbi:SAG-related sequence [Besnoitia besnoiti]|uniref:SAG-related sequence n=1 Tax=Besnoitia besnoiti TaxID=94643 RepID=A0A2A9MIJ3_BESBE|nr:SAG-related sequence [Besnoitia besnoiti]PFH36081.1 SAG-related sequence [Besnoitia besnoiti]
MEVLSCGLNHVYPALFTARQRRLRRQLCFFGRPELLVLLCCAVVASRSFSVTGEPDTEETRICVEAEKGTTCTCAAQPSRSEKTSTATISQEKNTLKMVCKEGLKCAPAELTGSIACVGGTDDLTECKGSTSGTKHDSCLDVKDILTGTTSSIQWKDTTAQGRAKDQSRSLTVPPETIPFVDEKFVVGCISSTSSSTTSCKVDVKIEARATAKNDQTVVCAYGARSNQTRQAVTLSPSQNSFTLVCGDKGEVLPKAYAQTYCSPDSKDASETCSGDYTTILAGYEDKWWSADDKARSFTLSVPADKFPSKEAKLLVGCRQEYPLSEDMKMHQQKDPPFVVLMCLSKLMHPLHCLWGQQGRTQCLQLLAQSSRSPLLMHRPKKAAAAASHIGGDLFRAKASAGRSTNFSNFGLQANDEDCITTMNRAFARPPLPRVEGDRRQNSRSEHVARRCCEYFIGTFQEACGAAHLKTFQCHSLMRTLSDHRSACEPR